MTSVDTAAMATNMQIRTRATAAAQQAAGVARSYNDGDMRVLAIAISETAQAVTDLAKRNRDLEDEIDRLKRQR